MNAQTDAQREREAEVAQWMTVINALQDAVAVNMTIPELPDDKLIKSALTRRAKALGLVWNGKEFAEKAHAAA
jgi:hypothetical protein